MSLRGFRLFHTVLSFLQYLSSEPPLHMSQSFSTTMTILVSHILTLKKPEQQLYLVLGYFNVDVQDLSKSKQSVA